MFWLLCCLLGSANAARIKDIADIYGVRENMVFGYGLVTGLRRTGDSLQNRSTIQSMVKRLQGLGITLNPNQLRSRNVASVMVTARIPATARPGQKIDIIVSSSGDANSLQGGVLQLTPLQAADGKSYAIAQGPIVLGGFSAGQSGSSAQKNHTTTGRVPAGATVEVENPNRLDLQSREQIDYLLRKADFTTAKRMADAINRKIGGTVAIAVDSGAVAVQVPQRYKGNVVSLLAEIEVVDVPIDIPAKVAINERTGTVVIGSEVKITPVAVAHGGLSINIQANNQASQPGAFSGGNTAQNQNARVTTSEENDALTIVGGTNIGELVATLNKMGIKPRDLIQILVAIKEAGALHAELEIL